MPKPLTGESLTRVFRAAPLLSGKDGPLIQGDQLANTKLEKSCPVICGEAIG
ncbi:hypothetical protein NG799_19210 [Laspinema sp. D1]|uniref:Uncharacterized protein n=1 Tax=Laspinema palackyanum D2a TaxID=2953684 RepID=A0ABT2MUK8_9CYAN|nr:hypothetical protein [Laspinema sp. D2a]